MNPPRRISSKDTFYFYHFLYFASYKTIYCPFFRVSFELCTRKDTLSKRIFALCVVFLWGAEISLDKVKDNVSTNIIFDKPDKP